MDFREKKNFFLKILFSFIVTISILFSKPTEAFDKEMGSIVQSGFEFIKSQLFIGGDFRDNVFQEGTVLPALLGLTYLSLPNEVLCDYADDISLQLTKVLNKQDARGFFKGAKSTFDQVFSILFLSEVYVRTSNSILKNKLQIVIQKGISVLENNRALDGGWNYSLGPNQSGVGISTGLATLTLLICKRFGFSINENILNEVIDWLRNSVNPINGGFTYNHHSRVDTVAMTALNYMVLYLQDNGYNNGKAQKYILNYDQYRFEHSEPLSRLLVSMYINSVEKNSEKWRLFLKDTKDFILQETQNGQNWKGFEYDEYNALFVLQLALESQHTLEVFNPALNSEERKLPSSIFPIGEQTPLIKNQDIIVEVANAAIHSWHFLGDTLILENKDTHEKVIIPLVDGSNNPIFVCTEAVRIGNVEYYVAKEAQGRIYLVSFSPETGFLKRTFLQTLEPLAFVQLKEKTGGLEIYFSKWANYISSWNSDSYKGLLLTVTGDDTITFEESKNTWEEVSKTDDFLFKRHIFAFLNTGLQIPYNLQWPKEISDRFFWHLLSLDLARSDMDMSRAQTILSVIYEEKKSGEDKFSAATRKAMLDYLESIFNEKSDEDLSSLYFYMSEPFETLEKAFIDRLQRTTNEKLLEDGARYLHRGKKIKYPEVALLLIKTHLNHSSDRVRQEMIRLFSYFPTEEHIELLKRKLETEDDLEIVGVILQTLGDFRNPILYPIFRKYILKTLDEGVGGAEAIYLAQDSIRALGKLKRNEDIEFIGEQLKHWDKPMLHGMDIYIFEAMLGAFEMNPQRQAAPFINRIKFLAPNLERKCTDILKKIEE